MPKIDIERRPDGNFAGTVEGNSRASVVASTQGEVITRINEMHPNVKPNIERVRHTVNGTPGQWRSEE